MLARLMVTRRRMRWLRFGGLGELSFVGDYSLAQQTFKPYREVVDAGWFFATNKEFELDLRPRIWSCL